jgi:hypothetical protein
MIYLTKNNVSLDPEAGLDFFLKDAKIVVHLTTPHVVQRIAHQTKECAICLEPRGYCFEFILSSLLSPCLPCWFAYVGVSYRGNNMSGLSCSILGRFLTKVKVGQVLGQEVLMIGLKHKKKLDTHK